MATDTLKSASPNPDSKNPTKTLTLDEPNHTDKSNDSSSAGTKEDEQAEPQLNIATVSSDEGTDQKDTKVKGSVIVSPRDDNDIQKKLRRAERFGVPVHLSEEEKRNSRAERFGTGTGTGTGSEASKTAEEQKRKARAERFGLPVPADDEAKKKARLARFGSDTKIDSQEEEKRKARAIRFSQPSSNNVPHKNHEGDVGQDTAIAGNVTGGA